MALLNQGPAAVITTPQLATGFEALLNGINSIELNQNNLLNLKVPEATQIEPIAQAILPDLAPSGEAPVVDEEVAMEMLASLLAPAPAPVSPEPPVPTPGVAPVEIAANAPQVAPPIQLGKVHPLLQKSPEQKFVPKQNQQFTLATLSEKPNFVPDQSATVSIKGLERQVPSTKHQLPENLLKELNVVQVSGDTEPEQAQPIKFVDPEFPLPIPVKQVVAPVAQSEAPKPVTLQAEPIGPTLPSVIPPVEVQTEAEPQEPEVMRHPEPIVAAAIPPKAPPAKASQKPVVETSPDSEIDNNVEPPTEDVAAPELRVAVTKPTLEPVAQEQPTAPDEVSPVVSKLKVLEPIVQQTKPEALEQFAPESLEPVEPSQVKGELTDPIPTNPRMDVRAPQVAEAKHVSIDKEPRQIARDVIDRIENIREIRPPSAVVIKMNPEGLGTVTVAVRSQQATITTDNQQVLHALQTHRDELQQTIQSKGMDLSQLNLQYQDRQQQNQPQPTRADFERQIRFNEALSPELNEDLTPLMNLADPTALDIRL